MSQRWWCPYWKTGNVTVFHIDLTPNAARETRALAWLDMKERARWNRFRNVRPQREFGLCRAALRAILCGQLDYSNEELAFDTLDYGKPFALAGGIPAPISFNISHSGKHGLIALSSKGRIGVDVEERIIRHSIEGTIQSAFSPDERSELASAEGEQKAHLFFRLWTMKEALVKALGKGLSQNMSEFEIPPAMREGGSGSEFRFPQMPTVKWWLENLGSHGFSAALAHELDPGSALEETGKSTIT